MFIVSVICCYLFFTQLSIGENAPDETSLKNTIQKIYKLAESGTDKSNREWYRRYFSNTLKADQTEEEFVAEQRNLRTANKNEGIVKVKYELNDIYLDGVYGYADRTVYLCLDLACTRYKEKWRNFIKYVFEDNKWKATNSSDSEKFCPRKQHYEMEPEFLRALSLISQRMLSDSNIPLIENCLDIQYAQSADEIQDSEGLFQFLPGQSPIKLEILVSPKYKQKDDLLTAFLLSHETEHASLYISEWFGEDAVDCFKNEGSAFNAQYYFLSQLNQEEKNALMARIYQNISPEVRGISTTFNAIQSHPGLSFTDKATNFVKSDPFYQEQCLGQ